MLYYKPHNSIKQRILDIRPVAVENYNPMARDYILRQTNLIQIKIMYLGEPMWINVDKKEVVEE